MIIYRLLILTFVLAIAATLFRYGLQRMVQARMHRKGKELLAVGINFDEWLQEAKVKESDLEDRYRSEVIDRMLNAADKLLARRKRI